MTTSNAFQLGTFALKDDALLAAIVLDGHAVDIGKSHALYLRSARAGAGSLSATDSVLGLLEDWDRNFAVLQALATFLCEEGLASDCVKDAVHALADLRPRPPVLRPSKILNCAANYSGHLTEMRAYTQSGGALDAARIYQGDKSKATPYLFLKAPSSLIGANDEIVMPQTHSQLDWEAELGVVIGPRARKVPAERALEHIAGFMIFNDVTVRDELFREDRPNFRTDWLSSKSYDTFAPAGPFLVPRAFVPSHGNLRIRLSVNGVVKQDGLAGDMIYSPEEQIEYTSRKMTLEPGDIFATGTLSGVGQGSGVFLRVGDVIDTAIEGLGAQRNRVVAAAD